MKTELLRPLRRLVLRSFVTACLWLVPSSGLTLAQSYAEGLGVYSIPRNWVVSVDGKLTFEGIGFGNEGEEWMKKATEMIQKVKGTN